MPQVESEGHRVGLVVDPSFGPRLEDLARRMHVWVLRSVGNEEVVRDLSGAGDGTPSLESGATLFGSPEQSAEQACEGIVGTIEEHHGGYSHDPPLDVVEVFGVEPTPPIRDAFAAYGFEDVKVRAGGFVVSRGGAS